MNAPFKTSKLIKGATGDWEVVIGMEIHAQVNSQAKLFSGAATGFGAAPNSQVSLVDAAMPGMLPVINGECIAQAVRTGLGLKAKINLRSVFDRKNYFYPDLPQGYQISQYKSPVVGEGEVVVDMPDGAIRVGIERLHLEQDAGKLIHDQHPAVAGRSQPVRRRADGDRPKPDLRSAEEAKAFLAKLRAILRYLGTCDGDMEKGNLRADVNVSVRRPGALGTRCEIKNVNSIRFVGMAATAKRGARSASSRTAAPSSRRRGSTMPRATRPGRCAPRRRPTTTATSPTPTCSRSSWARTMSRRSPARCRSCPTRRSAVHVRVRPRRLRCRRARRRARERRLLRSGGQARRRVRAGPKLAANWVINELFGRLNRRAGTSMLRRCRLALGAILDLAAEALSRQDRQGPVRDRVERRRRSPRRRRGARHEAGHRCLGDREGGRRDRRRNPDKVEQARAKPALIGWFVGQVMKASGGKANPQAVNDLLKAKLGL
jgi:aspartyl-tRNA(Asn)/glutamyl-tRNA(Gln) amidotransferase subunit B